jgi:Flp pilus assembly CpaE family ATPase
LIITVEPNRVSLMMGRELLNEIHQIGGAGATNVVIINRSPSSLQVPWQEAEHILEHEMTAIISPAPELAFQASENGVPIVLMQPEATVTSQYAKMVEELQKRVLV